MPDKYDVIVVGAGPAGIFAVLEICRRAGDRAVRILIIEKGHTLEKRRCPMKEGRPNCLDCQPCSTVCGWGGAGAFSDGKLTLTPEFGGFLAEILGDAATRELIDYVDRLYLAYGAPPVVYGEDNQEIRKIQRLAAASALSLIPARIRHLGTENCQQILAALLAFLRDKVEIITNQSVTRLLTDNGTFVGVQTSAGQCYYADYAILGPGRGGAEWFQEEARRLGLSRSISPVDIGIRVEVPAVVMEHLTDSIYESKLIYYSRSFDDRVRTFCMNPYGEVVMENSSGVITVNGHSYAERKTANTNFALLVSKGFTEPFKEPLRYGKYIASLANLLGGGVLVQRLGDLLSGRRSTAERIRRGMVQPTLPEATPGDLSLVLPYRHLISILEMLEALDKIAPGVYSHHTLLYGVEVKFYSLRLRLTPDLETEVTNMFAVGDGAGITRGLVQASASGVVAGRAVVNRIFRAP